MKLLKKTNWFLVTQVGIDIKKILKLYRLFYFLVDYIKFLKTNNQQYELLPCIHDKYEESGDNKNEYFWQDLFVAQQVFKNKPNTHFDIGGRIDGFVAHIASFRIINVIDIRPLKNQTNNINFYNYDIFNIDQSLFSITDSLSCLHTYEHFGLGRYGDLINENYYKISFFNLSKILKINGTLYFSTTIGKPRIFFNAHRISSYEYICDLFNKNGLVIQEMLYRKNFIEHRIINDFDIHKSYFDSTENTLVIFLLKKIS